MVFGTLPGPLFWIALWYGEFFWFVSVVRLSLSCGWNGHWEDDMVDNTMGKMGVELVDAIVEREIVKLRVSAVNVAEVLELTGGQLGNVEIYYVQDPVGFWSWLYDWAGRKIMGCPF